MCTKIDMYNTGKLLNQVDPSDDELELLLMRLELFQSFCDGVGMRWDLISRDIHRHLARLCSLKKKRTDSFIDRMNREHGVQEC